MQRFGPSDYPPIFSLVGNTPLLPVEIETEQGRAVTVDLKLEGMNPSGSVKDRAASWILRNLIDTGVLTAESTLLDASSGNMASALALFGKALGVGVHVVCNPTLTPEKARLITLLGATLIESDLGPFTHDAYRVCLRLLSTPGGLQYCFTDQLNNPLNPQAHELITAREIITQKPKVRAIVGSLGSGGTMTGIGRYVRDSNRNVRVVAVSSAKGTRFPGVGAFEDGDHKTPFITSAEMAGLFSDRVLVSAEAVALMMRQLLDRGVVVGAQTAAVTLASSQIADKYGLRDEIVAISGDAAWKNFDAILNMLQV